MAAALSLQLEYTSTTHCAVTIQRGLVRSLRQSFAKRLEGRAVLLVTDANVQRHFGDMVTDQLADRCREFWAHVIPPGEESKSAEQLQQLWNQMAERRMDRDAAIVVLGGGVVGDLAGCAAATFGRGLAWIQIPTTLIAQVDSSLGGKVGINLVAGKNLVGCVWQPECVLIDPELLDTLPPREFRSGLAEIAKYAVLLGESTVSEWSECARRLVDRDPDLLVRVIAACAACKLDLVQRDPADRSGVRAVLNYGHTFGHAIENVAGYGELTHGEAVAIGMSLAARLALRLGWVDPAFVATQDDLLQRFGLPTHWAGGQPEALLRAMSVDKKSLAGRMRFVLPRGFGNLSLTDRPTQEDVIAILDSE
jgi:3-dehydroquinate synthase